MAAALTLQLSVLADEGDGDGSGGGSGEPLMLDVSSVPDGITGVATDVVITLTFTKNVVNFSVKDNNMTCFTLTDSNGTPVPFSVLMGDDQVDPTIKRIIEIKPEALSPGTAYTLTVLKEVTSKSGVNLEDDVIIHFTTAQAEAAPAAPQPLRRRALRFRPRSRKRRKRLLRRRQRKKRRRSRRRKKRPGCRWAAAKWILPRRASRQRPRQRRTRRLPTPERRKMPRRRQALLQPRWWQPSSR
jgi:hypothetical protein